MGLKVGIQLYSVKHSIVQDPYEVLRQISEAGYRYVEAANLNADRDSGVGFGLSARRMKEILDELSLSMVGCHVEPLKEELMPEILSYHAELGNTQIGCGVELFPYGDLDAIKRSCQKFNRIGELCQEWGMRFYFHNHFQEFQQCGGKLVYDLIMENTDPGLVYAELDTYWAARGGQDPAALIRRYNDRIILLHVKDFPEKAPDPLCVFDGMVGREENVDQSVLSRVSNPLCFTELGTGILPIQHIIRAAGSCPNLETVLLEQDHTQLDEIQSINLSMQAFRRLKGVEVSLRDFH